MILLEKALQYCEDVLSGKEITTWEVKDQCKIFLDDYNINQHKDDFEFYADKEELQKINNLLKLINFATGFVAGEQVLTNLAPFQCFLICGVFLFRYKNNPRKFKHNDITLFIARKNAKTALVAIIFLLLMLTEQNYSEFYSICHTRELAAEIRKSMAQLIEASALIQKHFIVSKTQTGKIECKLTKSFFHPRTSAPNKNNSIRPSAFVSDEHGAFEDNSNFNAMRSGQKNVINPLVFRTTTAYAIDNSIMEEDLKLMRMTYRGEFENKRMFALLYYAEEKNIWNDTGINQSNPLRIEENYNIIRENRKRARVKRDEEAEFITKDVNVFMDEVKDNPFLDFKIYIKGKSKYVDLKGKEVIIGYDGAFSLDLNGQCIMYKEEDKYKYITHGYLCRGSLKRRREQVNYELMEKEGYCTILDGDVIDLDIIEEKYIRTIEDRYNCYIKTIVSDPYNVLQMMNRLSRDYATILIPQTYTHLSPALKQFQRDVLKQRFEFVENKIMNLAVKQAVEKQGSRTGDILLEKVSKKKNVHRIDLLMATVFAYSQLYTKEEEIDINKYASEELLDKLWG